MPVTTRSQSKKQQSESDFNTRLKSMLPMKSKETSEPKKPKTQLSKSDTDFTMELRNRIKESQNLKEIYLNYKTNAILTKDNSIKQNSIRQYKRYYFKNLSHLTKMFQLIDSQFGTFFVSGGKVSNKSASIQRLIDVILSKCEEFANDVEISCPKNLTVEYSKVLDDFKVQLKKTKVLFEPYASWKKEPRYPKRSIRPVCYTGMDTIVPKDEYDGITNIWKDNTKYTDPDYVYESDEDDEDDEDEYVSDDNEDEEEFEDYDSDEEEPWVVYEDEPEDCFVDKDDPEEDDFIVEKVNDRHVRFVYK